MTTTRLYRPARLAGTALAALALAIAGCSSSSDQGAGSSTGNPTPVGTTSAQPGSTTAPTSAPASSGSGQSGAAVPDQAALRAELPDAIKSSGVLHLGALWETPPGIAADPTNPKRPKGSVPDMADAVAEILGVKVEWQNMQWPAQLPGVQSGNVDALWGQISITPQREASVVDLVPYGHDKMALAIPAGNPKNIKSFADACGLKIAVPNGSEQSQAVKANSKKLCEDAGKPAIQETPFTGAQQAVVALKADGVDAWMDSGTAIDNIVSSDPSSFARLDLPDDQLDPYVHNMNGIAVGKANPGLSKALAGAMQILISDGKYQQILEKWKISSVAITADQVQINPYTHTQPGQTAAAAPTS